MIEMVFDQCVPLLFWLAGRLGVTYEAVNVWIFVIVWPLFTLSLVAVVIRQRLEIHRHHVPGGKPCESK